jgi:transposase
MGTSCVKAGSPLSQWLFSALAEAGLPVICVETRHMRAVLKAQINKTDMLGPRSVMRCIAAITANCQYGVELAWLWVRHQPKSAMTLWFEGQVKRNGGRHKKSTIVALARKLLVALWKYVTAGVVIEGAVMKTAG